CAIGALRDSGLWDSREDLRVGVVIGIGTEWFELWEEDAMRGGNRIYSPKEDTESLIGAVTRKLSLSGPAVALSAACASGNHALALARCWLEMGWADICLAGACFMGVNRLSLAGLGHLRALSRRNSEPQVASRPFDKDRDGLVMGEGGAVFVLEPASTARRRTARAYAEVAGCGANSDAY